LQEIADLRKSINNQQKSDAWKINEQFKELTDLNELKKYLLYSLGLPQTAQVTEIIEKDLEVKNQLAYNFYRLYEVAHQSVEQAKGLIGKVKKGSE